MLVSASSPSAAKLQSIQLPHPGWTPKDIAAQPSAMGSGFVRSLASTWSGKAEATEGQRLTRVQIATLAPFLSASFHQSLGATVSTLQQIGVYTGGPAADRGGLAVTLGHNIYVKDADTLQRIFSWEKRRWLVHEIGHAIQWQRTDGPSDLEKTRGQIVNYVAGLALDPIHHPGAVPLGAWRWITSRFSKDSVEKGKSLERQIHDAHWLEKEAEAVAQQFRKVTGG